MVGQIVWGRVAQQDRLQILDYWHKRNKSKMFSKKLNSLFNKGLNLVCKYPNIGKSTNKPNIRIKIVREYSLVYEILEDKIIVLRVWDSRRNPKELLF
jgi:plasmid stabilization system protein ParE